MFNGGGKVDFKASCVKKAPASSNMFVFLLSTHRPDIHPLTWVSTFRPYFNLVNSQNNNKNDK